MISLVVHPSIYTVYRALDHKFSYTRVRNDARLRKNFCRNTRRIVVSSISAKRHTIDRAVYLWSATIRVIVESYILSLNFNNLTCRESSNAQFNGPTTEPHEIDILVDIFYQRNRGTIQTARTALRVSLPLITYLMCLYMLYARISYYQPLPRYLFSIYT